MADLFHFKWPIDQHGYEPASAEKFPPGVERPVLKEPPIGGGWWIRRKGGPLRWYLPLEDRGLARRFANLPKEPQAMLKFVDKFGFLGVGQTGYEEDVIEEHSWYWRNHIEFMHRVVEAIDAGDKLSAIKTFNQHVEPHMTIWIEAASGKRSVLHVVPTNLLAAMWFEIAGELTEGTKYRKCEWCPTWFPYGPRTGHKKTRRFCSDRCRKASNRHQKDRG